MFIRFFFRLYVAHRMLNELTHSFPTPPSSDLARSSSRAMIQVGGLMNNGKGVGASAIALLAVLTAPALAQETPQGDASGQAETGLQDIVVTAQKRAENVQSVPVAITAVSGDMLTAKGIRDRKSVV